MKYTFVIPSIGRVSALQNCTNSIEKAYECRGEAKTNIEILIIYESDREIDLQIKYPNLFSFYRFDKIGLSAARNCGINNSKGDFLIFIDDDAAVNQNFINILSEAIMANRNVSAFCGRIIDPIKKVPFSLLFCNNSTKKLQRLDYQYFMGSAHVLSREVIKNIGYYDERFGSGAKYFASEETDMFLRLMTAKEPVMYLPELIFFHPIPATPSYVYKYAYAVGAVLTKHLINDKSHFITYCFIIFRISLISMARLMQKYIFRGIYLKKDEQYQYSSVLKGTFDGIRNFIANEMFS